MESERELNEWDNLNACYQRPPIPDLTTGLDARKKTPHISTRRQAIAAIRAECDAIFASRDKTRGTTDEDTLGCAVAIRNKANRLINQWKNDKPLTEEEWLDIANWATIALLIQRGQWTLPWEDA